MSRENFEILADSRAIQLPFWMIEDKTLLWKPLEKARRKKLLKEVSIDVVLCYQNSMEFSYKNLPENGTGGFFFCWKPFWKLTGCNDSSIKRGSEPELAVVLQRLAS